MVRALASGAIRVGSRLDLSVFLRVLQFPPSTKTNTLNSSSTRTEDLHENQPKADAASSLNIVFFFYFFCYKLFFFEHECGREPGVIKCSSAPPSCVLVPVSHAGWVEISLSLRFRRTQHKTASLWTEWGDLFSI